MTVIVGFEKKNTVHDDSHNGFPSPSFKIRLGCRVLIVGRFPLLDVGVQVSNCRYCGGLVITVYSFSSHMFYCGASKALNLCIVRGENPAVEDLKCANTL